MNRYAYVQNDPVNFVDPLGLNMIGPGSGGSSYCWFISQYIDDRLTLVAAHCMNTGGGGGGEGGGGGGTQQPKPKPPQEPKKPPCKQDKTGGDTPDILDLLGRAGVGGLVSNVRSAGPKNPEGILFDITNRAAFVGAFPNSGYRTGSVNGLEHISQVGASSASEIFAARSFTSQRDSLGVDSTGYRRSLQTVAGPERLLPTGVSVTTGYADLDCNNPSQDVASGGKHILPIIGRRIGRLFGF